MNQYQKLGKNIMYITIGNFASKVMSFLMIPFYTSVLTTNEYGIADLMTTTINLISPFFTALICEATIRFALDKDKDKSQVFTGSFTIVTIGFVAMTLFSPFILASNNLKKYYLLFVIYYFAVNLHNLVSQFARGIEKIALYSLSGVFQTVSFIVLNLLFLFYLKMGVIGYILSLVISNLLASIFLSIGCRLKNYLVSLKELDINLIREMLSYSIPMIPNSISWWVNNSADKYFLTFFSGVSVTGIYSVSQKIPSLFAIISTIFINAWQISAVEDFGSSKSRDFYSDIYNQYSSFIVMLASGLICITKLLASFLFSKDFFTAWVYTPILLFAFVFHSLSSFLGSIYTSSKKTRMLFISTMVGAVSNIILNLIMIPLWEGIGAAVATLSSYLIIWIIRLFDTSHIMKLTVKFKRDLISYLLITVEIIFVCLEIPYYLVLSFFIFIIICFINKDFIIKIFDIFIKLISKGRKRHV